MLAILPFLAWALGAFALMTRCSLHAWRARPANAMLLAAALGLAYLVAGTELLSLPHALNRGTVIALWLLPCAALAVPAFFGRRSPTPAPLPTPPPSRAVILLSIAIAAILIGIGLIAATTPTNTFDCLSYHLPRQVYWIQQASVAHYPAYDLRQLEMPPLLEFASAHLALLSGGWMWTNIPSWSALVLAAIAAYALAAELGGGAHARLLGTLLAITVPAAAMQGTDGKNDIAVTAFTLALAVSTVRIWSGPRLTWTDAALAGLFAGLLTLTKGTGFVFALPFAALIAVAGLRARGLRAIAPGALAAVLALALNAGHFARNYRYFGSPLGFPESSGGYHLANHDFSPAALISNIVRNLALHLGTPWPAFDAWQTRQVVALHELLGIGVNDPRTTSVPDLPFQVLDQNMMGGGEAAPVHLLLALIVAAILIAGWLRRRPVRHAVLYTTPFAGFLLFCILLRWQPWHMRLQAPAFVLLGAMSGPLLVRHSRAWLRIPIAALACAFLAYCACVNFAKPLIGHRNILDTDFAVLDTIHQAPLLADLRQAAPVIESLHPKLLGLQLSGSSLEFPVLVAARDMCGPEARIANFNPNFAREAGPAWYHKAPDAVLSWLYKDNHAWGIHYVTHRRYEAVLQCANGLTVLVPVSPNPPKPAP